MATRLGKAETQALFREVCEILEQCIEISSRKDGFAAELEVRHREAQLKGMQVMAKLGDPKAGNRKVVASTLYRVATEYRDEAELVWQIVDLHNRIYPEREWTGEF